MSWMSFSKLSPGLGVSCQLQPKTDSFDVLDDVAVYKFHSYNQQTIIGHEEVE
jgi:hypothetical protein